MSNEITRPFALIILDGWGVAPQGSGNAITMAHTPYYDAICAKYPRTALAASGKRVGLRANTPGNAEVGHLTIGAGRIVQTETARIAKAIASGEFLENPVLKSAFEKVSHGDSAVHFIGLISDAGIHSSPETLFALLRMAKREGVREAFIHGILDGRDVQPRTADIYVDALEIKMADIGIGKIASLCGRFYAMDDGENWERTARAYTMLVHGEGERSFDAVSAIRASFLRGIADEFIAPIIIEKTMGIPLATVNDGDLVVFVNHRGEQMRQLVHSLSEPDQSSAKPEIDIVCLTQYDRSLNLPVAFELMAERNVLAQIFEQNGVQNYRITETARSSHVSSYFNCNTPAALLEKCVIVPGSGGQSLEIDPESKSFKITDRLLRGIEAENKAVFVVNFPAPDLLAETGNLSNTIESIQYVDTCLGGVLEKIREAGGVALITSSHGNCEEMTNAVNGMPTTEPTTNPVPLHFIDHIALGATLSENGTLEDIAPTILGILGIEKPAEMTGRDLRVGS